MANENEGRVVVDDPRAAKVGGNLDGEVVPKAMGKEEVEGRALGADGRVVAVKRSPRAHAFVSLRVEITDQQLLGRGRSLAAPERAPACVCFIIKLILRLAQKTL